MDSVVLYAIAMTLYETLLFLFVLNRTLMRRFRIPAPAIAAALFIGQCVKLFIPSGHVMRFVSGLLIDCLMAFLFYRGNAGHAAVATIIFYDLMFICDGVIISAFQLLQLWRFQIVVDATIAEIAMSIASRVLLLPMVFIFLKLWPREYNKRLQFYPLPVLVLLVQIAFFPFDANSFYYQHPEWMFILVCLFIAVSFLCFFLVERQQHKLSVLEAHRQEQLSYIQEVNDTYKGMAVQIHDVRHHLGLIDAYLADGKPERARRYAASLDRNLVVKRTNYTGNADVDSIIYSKQMRCRDKIGFQVSGRLPAEISWIDTADLCVLLANALDNAIEACEGMEGAEIKVAFVYRDWLVISMENPITRVPERNKRGGVISRKGAGHGLGMKSMEVVVKKYNGHMTVEANKDRFVVDIILQENGV